AGLAAVCASSPGRGGSSAGAAPCRCRGRGGSAVTSAGPLLRVERGTKAVGGLTANRDVSLEIAPGEIVGLIGPNGAGKTTLFNCISGHYHPDHGRIVFDGHDVSRARPDRICHRGVARTWQIVRAF